MIQDRISPVSTDVEVVPVHPEEGFILDTRSPWHQSGPFMNQFTGGYLARSMIATWAPAALAAAIPGGDL